jgi:hypothetical protein
MLISPSISFAQSITRITGNPVIRLIAEQPDGLPCFTYFRDYSRFADSATPEEMADATVSAKGVFTLHLNERVQVQGHHFARTAQGGSYLLLKILSGDDAGNICYTPFFPKDFQ